MRSVAGLICDVGVLSAVQMSKFPEMWKAYQANTSGNSFKKSRWYLDNQAMLSNVRVKVIGVWDTVGALVGGLTGSGLGRSTDLLAREFLSGLS